MVNQKKTRKNKHLKFKLNLIIDELKNLTPQEFYKVAENFHQYESFAQNAIKIVSEEYKEKLYFFVKHYKDNFNTKKNIERLEKLTKLYNKQQIKFEDYPEYKILSFYQNTKNNNSTQDSFQSYPDLLEPDFTEKILHKKEFIDNIEKGVSLKKKNKYFTLTPSQTFLKNYISIDTPYNGLLLFHGTGVGKTCASISIAEQFIGHIKNNSTSKKKNRILVLASPNVQESFRREIINIDNFIFNHGHVDGCTGTKYAKNISSFSDNKIDEYKRSINNLIDENYEFKGYHKFANDVENIENKAVQNISETDTLKIEKIKKKKRKEYYSNTVIIIDEAHSIKSDKSSIESKKVPQILENVIRDSENVKLILLSATPMLDSCREIIFLLNLLLLNDNRPKIDESDVFDSNNNLIEGGKELLLKKSKGYISYIRGQSTNFPYRIYPDINKDPHVLKISKLPKYKSNHELIPEKNRIKYLKLVGSYMDEYQYNSYKHYLNLDGKDKNNFASEYTYSVQSLNIVFPGNKIASFGGIDKCFNKHKGNKYSYKSETLKKDGRFLKYNLIDKYSCKFKSIFNYIINSTGIIFIYSSFIIGGILPFSLFLEQNGFVKYGFNNDYNNMLDEPRELLSFDGKMKKDFKDKSKFKQATYITVVGNDNSMIKNDMDKINALNRDNNKYGEEIKVVLASKAGGEGIDLHRIREVHILEPWHNLNKIEQAIGRGIRNKSHQDLPQEERNVTVYKHVSLNPNKGIDKDNETTDIKMYREAEKKQINISEVEYELKRNSVNCFLNKEINMLTKDNIVNIRTSQNKKIKYNTVDKPFTNMCNFKPSCEYECLVEIDTSKMKVNKDTYVKNYAENDIKKIKILIKDMFLTKGIFTLDEIIEHIYSFREYSHIYKQFVYIAIDEIIDNKEEIIDMFERKGIMIYKNMYYIFKIIDNKENMTIHETRYPKTKKNLNFLVFKNTEKYKMDPKKNRRDIKEIINGIISDSDNLKRTYFNVHEIWRGKDKNVVEEISLEYMVDQLTYLEKLDLIQNLITNYDKWGNDPEKTLFYKCFEYNIAYKNNKPCGFILKKNNSDTEFYRYSLTDTLFYSNINLRWFRDKDIQEINNFKKSNILGFMNMDNRDNLLFKFITDVKLSDTHGTGKVCSHHEKPIIEKTVSKVLGIDIKKYRLLSKSLVNKKKLKKNMVCRDLEMLLRYNEKKKISNLKWFQRFLI